MTTRANQISNTRELLALKNIDQDGRGANSVELRGTCAAVRLSPPVLAA
jgi:hypothetical protein